MNWEVVIGLETHTQLLTESKIFSGASTAFGAEPNRQASPVDLALPGVLPVMNRVAVDCAIKLGLAVGARIAPRSVFARKNYFYPDLPKGYQISQYETPVVSGGGLDISWKADDKPETAVQEKYVHLTRAHLEEDAGKSLHEDFRDASGIDLNRAGTPLLEIVTEPDMRSAREAVAYARTLHSLVMWLGICDGNMQEGSFRCDANVSIRPFGQKEYGTRCEIKNLNSFRFLERAIDFEVRRQIELIEDGGRVIQETRLYDPDKDETRSMRSKEDAHDYRYFPDPDLPPLIIGDEWIAAVRATLPELPAKLRERWVADFGLSNQDANALSSSHELATWFEELVVALAAPAGQHEAAAKLAANWVMADLSAALNRDGKTVKDSPVSPGQLAQLLSRITDGTVSGKIAKEIFSEMWSQHNADLDRDLADRIIDAKGLRQISDHSAIERIVDDVLAAAPKLVEEFRAGKERAFNALVGQVMKASKGKVNPQQANAILRQRLG
jgi:aspartyl-tRNA(Asn)/glutamyl-tRNA(Gln) amidotransferase subunit B